jgi:NAD(P)-dependent dehydrogenase (short-subunit alcohol dehydrogenase family)
MVKALLPIFKQQSKDNVYGDAQILNVNSMASMIPSSGIMMSPYDVAKNAAESFTDGIRLEFKMFGIQVVSVNPSMHNTPLVTMAQNALLSQLDQLPDETKKEYGEGTCTTCFRLLFNGLQRHDRIESTLEPFYDLPPKSRSPNLTHFVCIDVYGAIFCV